MNLIERIEDWLEYHTILRKIKCERRKEGKVLAKRLEQHFNDELDRKIKEALIKDGKIIDTSYKVEEK